jgi:hypothetical protein
MPASTGVWRAAASNLLGPIERSSVRVTDEILDIGAYLVAAKDVDAFRLE